ncbi:MAG: FAD-binding oxidoreductase [Chloroflexi bacterium]|nr:FAD-binding oxidoreductase [Chloroflexota bacterium]
MPEKADVIVVGGGVMGAAAAYFLTRLGVKPLLLERATLGSGGTGRSLAILRMHYSNEITVRIAHESHRIIAAFLEEVGAPSGFVRTGYLLLAGPGQENALRRNVALGRRVGVKTESLSPADAAKIAPPGFSFDGVAAVAYEPESGYADSSAVLNGFASAARAAGAKVQLGTNVTAIRVADGRVVGVDTDRGRLESGAVIVVAGPWTPDLLAPLGIKVPLSVVRHQVVRLHRPLDRLPSHPTVGDVPGGLSFRPDSGDVTLVGVREDPAERDTFKQSVDTDVAEDALTLLAKRHSAFADAGWDGGWCGLFDITPDWHPIIDRVPEIEGLVLGVGFSGHGFKLSPAVGRALAELAVHGRASTIEMQPLRFARFEEGDLLRSAYGGTVFA